MKKRTFLRIVGAVSIAAGAKPVFAQVKAPQEQLNPYIQVKTVPGDEFTVRAFFSPACPFSKQYAPMFRNLANTLPTGQHFEYTPLVNKGDGIAFPMAFYAIRRYYPQYIPNFIEASMKGVQELGLSVKNWAAIEKIARAAHVPVSVPQLVSQHWDELQKEVDVAILRQRDLKITNTPTISVAGTYTVTPEFTGGDAEQFSRLVNGVISMATLQQ